MESTHNKEKEARLLKSICLKNILSFNQEGIELELKSLKMINDSIKECNNSEYNKSESFKILEKVCVRKIVEKNSYAKEFFEYLRT